ncbi:high mobility group protein B2-like [Diretmus argenteus]
MVKDATKPKGKTSSYAYFVQTCRKELVKKCSEQWKTMSAKEKVKFEALAKTDKARYDEEMRSYVPPKGTKAKREKDPNAPKRPLPVFFVFCSDHRAKIKAEHPALSLGEVSKKLGELWSKQGPKDKAPYEAKAAKLKEKYEKDVAAYKAKGGPGKSDAGKKGGPARPTGKKPAPDDDEEDHEEDEEEEEDC